MTGNDRKIMFILAAISAIIGVMLATQLRSNLSPQTTESRSITELRSTLQKELEKHKSLLADISKYELLFYQYETALDEGESVEVMKEELARARKLAGMVSLTGPGITVRIVDGVHPQTMLLPEHGTDTGTGETDLDGDSKQELDEVAEDSPFSVSQDQTPSAPNNGSDFTDNGGIAATEIRGDDEASGDAENPVGNPPPLLMGEDLHLLVNELLVNGAKAVSINGHRLIATSAIRNVGNSIQVNTKFIQPPYVIKALGDPETLISGLKLANIEGYFQLVNKTVLTEKHEQLYIPAYQDEQSVRYMRPVKAKGDS
ncbi:DUF881 domain-containing protein [Brevibacillus humidisoli]|uniref:DUF881 domain-containing protein n=1 Tax=Brevibacillus humidisoli TaxID=2895522 RepID=UPI001E38C7A9|nr:DUF881 domain-containing protein [Brevibacillus humidisoli]UFJ41929.1 DUF881 domain-containing protein [Brevibacillus humidisoli]